MKKLTQLNLNLLHALDALLAERNVTHAAARLSLSQQALSGSLQRLREFFNDELLIRVGRSMEPTPLGAALRAPVREVLLETQLTLRNAAPFLPATARDHVRIAVADYAICLVLPTLMAELGREAPRLTIDMESPDALTFGRLESGEIDLCMMARGSEYYSEFDAGQAVRTAELFGDDFVCVLDGEQHAAPTEMTLATYEASRHAATRFGPTFASLAEQSWKAAGLRVNVAATATTFSATLFMLPGTPLVATVQRRLAELLAPSLRLTILECPITILPIEMVLAWHARNELDKVHRYVRDKIIFAAAAIGDSPHATSVGNDDGRKGGGSSRKRRRD